MRYVVVYEKKLETENGETKRERERAMRKENWKRQEKREELKEG